MTRSPPLRGDHHGRKRPLGAGSRAGVTEGHRAGTDDAQAHRQAGGRARDRAADRLRLLDRELVAAARGGDRPDEPLPRADQARGRGDGRGGGAAAVHRSPRPDRAAGGGGDRLGGAAHGAARRAHGVRRLRLRGPRRDPARGPALRRRRRGGVPPPSLRTRPEGSGADHPHGRRAAPLELPPLGGRLLGALLLGPDVARLRPRGVRAGTGLFGSREYRFGGR